MDDLILHVRQCIWEFGSDNITINNNPSHNIYIVIAKNSICKVITKTVFATCKGNVELIVLQFKTLICRLFGRLIDYWFCLHIFSPRFQKKHLQMDLFGKNASGIRCIRFELFILSNQKKERWRSTEIIDISCRMNKHL